MGQVEEEEDMEEDPRVDLLRLNPDQERRVSRSSFPTSSSVRLHLSFLLYNAPADLRPPPLALNSNSGSIIGKAGAKINEIRQASQCQIKINEPGEGTASAGGSALERLVTITGQPSGIQVAVRLLYERLEQEKQKRESFFDLERGWRGCS